MNYYRRYPGDYARDTQHLSMAEHGAYVLLMDYLYGTQRDIPGIDSALFRICRAHSEEEKSDVKSVIGQFFVKTDSGYTNKRASEEIRDAESRINAAIQNGKRGGRKTQREPNGNLFKNPQGNPQESYPSSNLHTPSAIRQDSNLQQPTNGLESKTAPPALVPVSIWLSFVEMRKKKRQPLTEHAGELIRRKLEELKEQGHDPIKVLEQSIMHCWAGVFPPKEEANGNGNRKTNTDFRGQRTAGAVVSVLRTSRKMATNIRPALPASH